MHVGDDDHDHEEAQDEKPEQAEHPEAANPALAPALNSASQPARKRAASKRAAPKPKPKSAHKRTNAAHADDKQQETDAKQRTLKRQQSDTCWSQAELHETAKEARQTKADAALADLRRLHIPELYPEPNFNKKSLEHTCIRVCRCAWLLSLYSR